MTHPSPTEEESALRERHTLHEEVFEAGGLRLTLILPEFSDRLIVEESFERDDRLPYWAELWPAARAMARWLLENPPPEAEILEIGSGLALPSLALRHLGRDPLVTDYEPEALTFARVNAALNGIAPLRTREMDWRAPDPPPEPAALLLGSDLLYETRNVEALDAALPRLIAPGGRALFSDPGRIYLSDFVERAARWGSVRQHLLPPEEGMREGVRLVEIRLPG